MEQKFITLLMLILGTVCSVNAQTNELSTAQDSLNHLLNEYYRLNVIVFQPNSTIKDIDNIFDLFTDDFTYVHEQYGGVYTRQDLYNGYKRNQENGGYDGEVTDIKVNSKIFGYNAIAVTKSFILKKEGGIKTGDPQMALFEFKDGKIYRITEYWK
ncbi:nuclear transport factor 2 family protein [Fulvivirga lutimaris]|uniref:nuclear transport factor 2 family protein n=1 Tax=Fulvivirga lutimaris TaxID=1819566 RepID=UPI0012BD67A7|nr:nuclear transport factor 2 family protein [Fulvivirga lutimaris]MTI39720.1 nuclear transport factor 2 family protein [Fulvivirga lutimaris]